MIWNYIYGDSGLYPYQTLLYVLYVIYLIYISCCKVTVQNKSKSVPRSRKDSLSERYNKHNQPWLTRQRGCKLKQCWNWQKHQNSLVWDRLHFISVLWLASVRCGLDSHMFWGEITFLWWLETRILNKVFPEQWDKTIMAAEKHHV